LKEETPKVKKALLLGLGLDGDGHTRITTGKNFALLGGSRDTHEFMVEKAIKFNEVLGKRSKTLEEVSGQEFREIAHEIGLARGE
jgi:hypothetical protein